MSNDNIFEVLKVIDSGNHKRFSEVQDAYNPFMTLHWLASCKDSTRVDLVNRSLNLHTFNLSSHPELLFKLACAISDGKPRRYQWVKGKKLSKTFTKKEELISQYFDISLREARDSQFLYETEDIVEMAIELGYTDKEITKIAKSQ